MLERIKEAFWDFYFRTIRRIIKRRETLDERIQYVEGFLQKHDGLQPHSDKTKCKPLYKVPFDLIACYEYVFCGRCGKYMYRQEAEWMHEVRARRSARRDKPANKIKKQSG